VAKSPPKSFHFDKRIHQILKAHVGAPDELLTSKQVADLLGVSSQWVEIARSGKYGPKPTYDGRRVRYKRMDINAFLYGRLRALAVASPRRLAS